ncbi:hypothetical protein [Terribacillus saccharophilus]|uniref:Uncharacterized protein n=1 Tax=Terribacillus saccharophilus TaxID=361277 RepID=A0A268A7Q8_9BACI|nr:hypothetical protein [Terribacillus saccharophilus]PAD20157.1 hypothetical protein CHH64_15575 [Terribacillus saccharophilus]
MRFRTSFAILLGLLVFASASVNVQAATSADYTDHSFRFDFKALDENDVTPGRKKGSDSSMYINNTSSLPLKVTPQVDSKKGTGTSYVKANKRGAFTAHPKKRYEVYNVAHENYWDGVQVRFHAHYDLLWGSKSATVKWSPDYKPDGASVIGL